MSSENPNASEHPSDYYDRYSRQHYVLGEAAMNRMAKSNVFISGLGGVGVEISTSEDWPTLSALVVGLLVSFPTYFQTRPPLLSYSHLTWALKRFCCP